MGGDKRGIVKVGNQPLYPEAPHKRGSGSRLDRGPVESVCYDQVSPFGWILAVVVRNVPLALNILSVGKVDRRGNKAR